MALKKTATKKSKFDVKTVIEELKTPMLVVLGMVGGTFGGKMLDKVIKVDETVEGFQLKSLAKPIIQITTGLGGALLFKDKNLKLIAGGIAASGIASSVKVFLKKDILNGFGDTGISRVFSEPINLTIGAYNPELPQFSARTEYMNVENPENQVGELVEYQEIGEIGIL